MSKFENLMGQKFGRLTVIAKAKNDKANRAMWLCKCECGNKKVILASSLKHGKTKSCGCLRKDRSSEVHKKHGLAYTKLYTVWLNMKNRCYNSNNKKYKNYGGRGIIICDEWKNDFMSFYNWAIQNGYKHDLTIDRINNNGIYEPSNCRWATMKEQCNNKRNNHLITYNNKTYTIEQWSKIIGVEYNTLSDRINKYCWTVEKALTIPVRDKK